MKPTLIELTSDLVIIGPSVRTSPATAGTDIPALWQSFMAGGMASKLPARKDDAHLYAVYCDYQTDSAGRYTMVLGVAADAAAPIAEGTRRVRIPAGKYASFVAKGDPAKVIWQTWMHVNTEWDGRARRRYIADFERYDPSAMSPGKAEAAIVVGID